MAEETASSPVGDPDAVLTPKRQQRRGFVSRLLRGIFAADNDIQKKLEHISKEEASIHARLKRRAQSSRKIARNVIFLSVIVEVGFLFDLRFLIPSETEFDLTSVDGNLFPCESTFLINESDTEVEDLVY